jgi:hypothetical protein
MDPWRKRETSPQWPKVEKKKEGTGAKQLRPKADQAVSSVSAVPALVNNIRLAAQLKGRLSLQEGALVYFSNLMFWQSSERLYMAKILCISWRQIRITETYRIDSTRILSFRPRDLASLILSWDHSS